MHKANWHWGFAIATWLFLATLPVLAHDEDILVQAFQQLQQQMQQLQQQMKRLEQKIERATLFTHTFTSPYEITLRNLHAPDGIYKFKIDKQSFTAEDGRSITVSEREFTAYCRNRQGKMWVMLYNSVKNAAGEKIVGYANTRKFWKISYADRFASKGEPDLGINYYNGQLYLVGAAEFIDEVEGVKGKVVTMFHASASGIDPFTMRIATPTLLSGLESIYKEQFASGWSSYDFDGDDYPENCASEVTQHYRSCFDYNLGSQGRDRLDVDWGPHVYKAIINLLGLSTMDGRDPKRVNRITRWIHWK